MRNLQIRFIKIVLELFDVPVNSWTEGENTMWRKNQDNCFVEGCESSYEQIADASRCGYMYHSIAGKMISSVILLT